MFRNWTNLLPVFVARWLAIRYAGRIVIGRSVFVEASPGTYFKVTEL